MLIAVVVMSLSVTAQEKTDTVINRGIYSNMTQGKHKDCVMMKDGKMMQMKAGKTMMMEKDMTFPNGAMVMKNGTMKMKDGITHMLREGEGVLMDGTMKTMTMKKMMKDTM